MVNINLKIQSICSSTNDLAFQAANDGLDQGTSYLSYKQTKGRGRNNNKWNSLEGNLFLSTIIRPIKEKKHWQQLSLIVGYSIIQSLIDFGIKSKIIELKWPNDVLVDNKKISGILLESSERFIVAGIGLNILKNPTDDQKWHTTKVNDHVNLNLSLEQIAYVILKKVFFNYKIWNDKGFIHFKEKINKYIKYRGDVININFNSNTKSLRGILLGLGNNGFLMINSGTSILEYNSIDSYHFVNKG